MEKEKVEAVVELEDNSFIPTMYHWIAEETWAKYGDELRDFSADFEDDFLVLSYGEPEDADDTTESWGLVHESAEVGGRSHSFPLNDWQNLDEYLKSIPDPHAKGRFESFVPGWTNSQLRRDHPGEKLNTKELLDAYGDCYKVGLAFPAINERMMGLRDPAKLWGDFYTNRDKVEQLGDALMEYNFGLIEEYAQLGIDAVWFSDDWGTQETTFISPEMWKEIFQPWYEALVDKVHAEKMHAFFHCCGQISELIPGFVAAGVDVMHLGQPYTMDIEKIVKRFSEDLCFFGGIDVQKGLMASSPGEVKEHVKKAVEVFDRGKASYIAGQTNSVTPDVPLNNIKAMYEAMEEYTTVHQ